MTTHQDTNTNPEEKISQAQEDLMDSWGKALGGGITILTMTVASSFSDISSKINHSPSYGLMALQGGLAAVSAYLFHSAWKQAVSANAVISAAQKEISAKDGVEGMAPSRTPSV